MLSTRARAAAQAFGDEMPPGGVFRSGAARRGARQARTMNFCRYAQYAPSAYEAMMSFTARYARTTLSDGTRFADTGAPCRHVYYAPPCPSAAALRRAAAAAVYAAYGENVGSPLTPPPSD